MSFFLPRLIRAGPLPQAQDQAGAVGLRNAVLSKFHDDVINYRWVVQALHVAGYAGYICVE